MVCSYLLVFCLMKAILIQAADANPVIKIDPAYIIPGITQPLIVECSFQTGSSPYMATIFSLSLSHSKNLTYPNFETIVSVNYHDGVVKSSHHKSLNASGLINNKGLSYLNVTLARPSYDIIGIYKCEAHGLISLNGQSQTYSNLAFVNAIASDVKDVATNETQQLQEVDFQNMCTCPQPFKEETKKAIELNRAKISQIELENSALKANQERLNLALENARNAYFYVSEPFQGKRYLLTREASFYYPSFGQHLCALHGGYLVEVDTRAEFDFVRNFIITNGSKFSAVMAGGTDEGHEGYWTNRYSKTLVADFWAKNRPDNYEGQQNCQSFFKPEQYYMDDHYCKFNFNSDTGFVCEVPN